MPSVDRRRRFLEKLGASLSEPGVCLRIVQPGRPDITIGEGPPTATATVHTKRAARRLFSLSENALVEAYLAGEIDIEGRFVDVLKVRDAFQPRHGLAWIGRFLVPWLIGQPRANRTAIDQHYDLPPEFYLSFLDSTWPAYSQGIFASEDEPLADALARKFDFVVDACDAGEGTTLLEVGPGWGAFVRYMQTRDAKITALTNSGRSRSYLQERFASPSLEVLEHDFLTFRPRRRFDLISIMGVLEHLPDYRRVCVQLRKLLRPGGYAYLDASAARVKFQMSQFIYKHIFPLNHSFLHLPSFVAAAIEEGLAVLSVHDDSRSYQYTIERWARNFEQHHRRLAEEYGEYHSRRFRLYLWASAHAFSRDQLQCYRLVLRSPATG